MSDFVSFLWSSILFFVVAIPLLLVAMAAIVLLLSPVIPLFRVLRQVPWLLQPNDPSRLEKFHILMASICQMQGYDVAAFNRIWDDWFGKTQQYLGVIDRRWIEGTSLRCEAYATQAGAERHFVLWIQRGGSPLNTSYEYMVLDPKVQDQLVQILGPTEDEFLRRVVAWKPSLQALLPLQAKEHGRIVGIRATSGSNGRLFSYRVVKEFGLLEQLQWPVPKLKGNPRTTSLQIKADVGEKDDEIIVVVEYTETTGGQVHTGNLTVGPVKGEYSVQSLDAEPNRTRYPFGKAGRDALRRLLANALDTAAAA